MKLVVDLQMRQRAMRLLISIWQSKRNVEGFCCSSKLSLVSHRSRRQPLIFYLRYSERTRLQHCISAPFPNAGSIDRLSKARDYGCNVGTATTIGGLMEVLREWGVDPVQSAKTVRQYDQVRRLGKSELGLDAPVGRGGPPPVPLVEGEGPFYAMEVQPS